jgi:flavodoxin
MKILIKYYSRTGTTKKVAEYLAQELAADIEEIIDLKSRKGPINYVIAGKDATKKKLTDIKKSYKNPEDYDMIILGTPVWAWTVTPAIRTYIKNNIDKIKSKHIAAFCTMGANGDKGTFEDIEEMLGKPLISKSALLTKEVVKEMYKEKIIGFLKEVKVHN